MENYPEKINIDELFVRKYEVAELKTRTFKKILSRIHHKIKLTSRQKYNEPFCFYVVPEFLVGTPRYDSAACTAYIMDKLRANGFYLKYTHPNLLFISWQHYIDKIQRANFKKAYGYTIDGFGNRVKAKSKVAAANRPNHNTMLMRSPAVLTTATKKMAANYRQTSTYKPTGNLIYNTILLKKVESKGDSLNI